MNSRHKNWRDQLSNLISSAEKRVENLKKIVGKAGRNQEIEIVKIIKPIKKNKELYLKSLRKEKTDWNNRCQ